jgi:Zn-dependent M28 family amino/carboxypeptidase
VSAHYDHLGIGPEIKSDKIYNGAFDNALGVSALMELARTWTENPTRRSILFIATTGEEKGLLGSSYYVRHPLVPLYKTIAAVNIDGIAVIEEFGDIVGIGAEYSDLGKILDNVASKKGLKPTGLSPYVGHKEAFTRSDQVAFAEGGIPSILLLEGLNLRNRNVSQALALINKWGQQKYHSPFDDLNQPVNWNAVKQHFDLIRAFVRELGNIEEEPEWNQGTPYIHARLQSIAEKR